MLNQPTNQQNAPIFLAKASERHLFSNNHRQQQQPDRVINRRERVSERVTNAATAKKPTDARTTRKRQRKHPHRKSIHPARAAPRAPSFLLLPVASPKTGRTVGLCGPAYSLASTSQSVRIRWSYRSVRLFGCAFGLELGVAGDNAFR